MHASDIKPIRVKYDSTMFDQRLCMTHPVADPGGSPPALAQTKAPGSFILTYKIFET